MNTISNPLEKQVIRIVQYGGYKYLVIMDESIANVGNGRNINGRYTLLCNHTGVGGVEIDFEHCKINDLNENVRIYMEDMFSLPTVDECIKFGMLLRHNNRRFNLKKNEMILK